MPQCSFNHRGASAECSDQLKPCSAVMNSAHLLVYGTADSHPQHTCSSQAGQSREVCRHTTNQVCLSSSSMVDAEEEALTLEYQPASNQHISNNDSVGMLDGSKGASRSATVTNSSRECHGLPQQKSRRQRVWHNKHYRRDGVMDLWTRAGLRLQSRGLDQ